jgi:4-amino-4-deoxy-L-arabinose transferase-like glycosyltransferase
VMYLLVKKVFDEKTALIAALLYSFSGFSIAFSRTAQYQSVLTLFGLLGLLFFILYCESRKVTYLLLSAVFYTVALYSHYDAIFYIFPTLFFVTKDKLKDFVLVFIMPIVLFISMFYVPYIVKGYFQLNTLGYLSKRLVGDSATLPNNSLYTFSVYNPFVGFMPLLLAGAAVALIRFRKKYLFLFMWFVLPFIVFELIFKNPGTHILQYFVPVYILAAYGFANMLDGSSKVLKYSAAVLFTAAIFLQILIQLYVFIPAFKSNYPWVESKVGFTNFQQAEKKYQLFLYGFPYNRGWDQAAKYLNSQKGTRGFYTNDNTVVAKYYVKKLDITVPASNFYPQYYVYVKNSQELRYPDSEFLSHYNLVSEVNPNITVYKRLDAQQ